MKKLLLIIIVTLTSLSLNAQCVVDKCINASATAEITNAQPTWTYNWSSTLAGFTGQGTSQISWASVGSTITSYNVSVVITDGATGCDTTVVCTINVLDNPVVTLNLPDVCFGATVGVPISGGSPAGGVYLLGGVAITTLTPTNIGQNITYELTASGCTGTATDVLVGSPAPNAVITIN